MYAMARLVLSMIWIEYFYAIAFELKFGHGKSANAANSICALNFGVFNNTTTYQLQQLSELRWL
jgi:hypothetical protein